MENNLYLTLSDDDKKSLIEALIFASDEPLSPEALIKAIFAGEESVEEPQLDKNGRRKASNEEKKLVKENSYLIPEFEKFVAEINKELAYTNRPYRIVNFAGGWSFATNREYGELISGFYRSKSKRKLSQASLETLAVIAYKQPVSKPEIEQIRGVNSSEVVNALLEKGFVAISGRSDAPGKPLLYEVTKEFLSSFGLNSLADLPKLKELDEFSGRPLSIDEPNIYKFRQPQLIAEEPEIKVSLEEDVKMFIEQPSEGDTSDDTI